MKREIEAYEELQKFEPHSNVCNVYDHGHAFYPTSEPYEIWYLVLPRFLGDMLDVVEVMPLSIPGATGLLAQVAAGLQHIHSKGMAHRDLKLENILIKENHDIIIADFGVSTMQDFAYTYCGTHGYLSPEVGRSYGYCTQPADVWSMGILFAVSILGTFPFPANANEGYRAEAIRNFAGHCNYAGIDTTRSILFYMLHPNPQLRLKLQGLRVVGADHHSNEIMRNEIKIRLTYVFKKKFFF